MLYKDEIIKIIKDMDLPVNEFWITSGAGLVLHGVKESTKDIDIGGTANLAEHFIELGCQYKIANDNTRIVEINDKVELLENWYVDRIKDIEGLPVASLDSIKKQKVKLGREKDFKDIELIDEFMKRSISYREK